MLDDLPAVLRFDAFTVGDADREGVPRSRLRRKDLARPFRGVRAAGPDPVDPLSAAAVLLGEHQFVSHVAAARVWGIRLPRRVRSRAIDVSALVPHHAPRVQGIARHRLQEERVELELVDGIPVTTPTETWRHLSTLLSLDELVAAGDSLVRRQDPLATPPQLVRALARHAGQRGVRRLRLAHGLVRQGTDSARETRVRLLLQRAGLPEPEVNGPIDLPGYGRAFGDLVYREVRVLVEYDGIQHRLDRRQFERDILRFEALHAAGWRDVRILAAHLRTPDDVIARVRAALARE
jgi:hypothetical protein